MLDKRNKILIAFAALSLYASYEFAIKNTLALHGSVIEKEARVEELMRSKEVVQELLSEEKGYDRYLSKYNDFNPDAFQNELLNYLSAQASGLSLKITDFQKPHTILDNDFQVSSYVFTLQGDYNHTILLLNRIENLKVFGSMKHIGFTRKTNYKSGTDELYAEGILQTIRK